MLISKYILRCPVLRNASRGHPEFELASFLEMSGWHFFWSLEKPNCRTTCITKRAL